ncbi:dephospho-CoA kinase [Sphingomonas metalli]|uniref:Dephospho-CoA kinase n=1 Tax=Sphingomonas metalli TaxID=1779358 RepID=A0A916TB41_9SPHN|nr:dephospho-CoA kinase [Sphingomonas metalli]GGB38689.1 dephospho-CoA kinase [Sphingomonas metalli]
MTIRLGLTGSIGMGKSTVAAMFAADGVPVFDADAEVHRLQGPGGALVPAIETAFPGTTGPGGVDRAALGRAVLADDDAMTRLERIVHPAVFAARAAFLAAHRHAPLVLLDIPLLFETGGEGGVDRIAVVSAAPAVQRARVLARPGMTEAKFAAILARQLPDAEKRARADHVIATDVPLADTRAAVRAVIACMGAGGGR